MRVYFKDGTTNAWSGDLSYKTDGEWLVVYRYGAVLLILSAANVKFVEDD